MSKRGQFSLDEYRPYSNLMGDSQLGIISSSNQMREKYTQVQSDLLRSDATLLNKDWDFSIDEAGEIVIIEGDDSLSESEINKLTKVLADNGIDTAMEKLAENVINHGIGARGPEGFSEDGSLASYDVNKGNFKDVIFGRELMLGMKIDHETKLTNADTLAYASKKVAVTSESNINHVALRAREAYNEGKQLPSKLVATQIMMRAVEKY
ncbi:hypothetical protein HF888_13890 [Bermanella marisrubri]|nr:hypothetical protein HF888_13890 [Bermanella marisrubri]